MRIVRTFVCHGSHTVELVEGSSLVVGRGSHCDIVLDDDLASREHMQVRLEGGRLIAADLKSRNGVLVNGAMISGEHELHHGDHITVGRTPISILRQVREPRRTESQAQPFRITSEIESTEQANLFDLLEGSARRALEDGDLTTAEGSARSLLVAIRGRVARGRTIDPAWVPGAVALVLDLSAASNDAAWVERSLDLYTVAKRPMDAQTAARVAEIAARVRPSKSSFDEYLAMARACGDSASVAALERVAGQLGR